MNEAERAAYRLGHTAGYAKALWEQQQSTSQLAVARPRRASSVPPSPKCVCGHAMSTHNELGYCQGRKNHITPESIDGCHCEGWTAPSD